MHKDATEFMECTECSAKPGSPILCTSCLNNRSAISSALRSNQLLIKDRMIELVTILAPDDFSLLPRLEELQFIYKQSKELNV